jgi:hypothetical protein
VHATRRGGEKWYAKRDIDVIAAHVQPEDTWYLIPIEKAGSAKSLRLYPGIESTAGNRNATRRKSQNAGRSLGRRRTGLWEQWTDRWDLLNARQDSARWKHWKDGMFPGKCGETRDVHLSFGDKATPGTRTCRASQVSKKRCTWGWIGG